VAAAKGALEANTPEVVNYVNAMLRRRRARPLRQRDAPRGAGTLRALAAVSLESAGVRYARPRDALFAGREARVVEVDDRPLEFRPEGTVVFLRNRDVPGVSAGSARSSARVASTSGTSRSRAGERRRGRGDRRRLARRRRPSREAAPRRPGVDEVRVVSW
jgi:hypothetical protein